jgi:DNA-directed RNA polymerase specialized sigma24 family protein
VPKSEWRLSELAFRRLLNWIDEEGPDSQGERYVELRRRLVAFFDRKNCASPDDLADETLNRVARRLEETGSIEDTVPARYCYIVARYVFLETIHQASRDPISLSDLPAGRRDQALASAPGDKSADGEDSDEQRLACLRSCLGKLDDQQREMICQYYLGEQRTKIENRRAIAVRLGLTMNALSIRACRVRARLEGCVAECITRQAEG